MLPLRRITRAVAIPALVTVTAVCIAACGGSNKPSKSSHGANGSSNVSFAKISSDAYKNSACMRRHGVPNFPDPQTSSGNGEVRISVHITPSITESPAFQSAQKACAYLMPGGGKNVSNGPSAAQQRIHTEGLLAFAACMRKRGFPRFPDPTSQGQLSLSQIESAGINLEAPAVKPAALACASTSLGQISKADVERAIANPDASGSQSGSTQGRS